MIGIYSRIGKRVVQIQDQLHPSQGELVLDHGRGAADDLVDVGLALLRGGLSGKIQKTLDDLAAPYGFGNDDIKIITHLGLSLRSFQQIAAVGKYGGQRIVDLVCNSSGQSAQGGKLVRLE